MTYAGFWPRFAAIWLDFLIVSPLIALNLWGSQHLRLFDVYYFLPGTIFGLFYSVYLVRRFGGTPGKRLMKLRIVKVSGNPVTYREAILRHLPEWLLGIGLSVCAVIAVLRLTDAEYFAASTFLERGEVLANVMPSWYSSLYIAFQVWIWSEFVVMLTNKKRRAIHDFIAGTVVIKELPPGLPAPVPIEAEVGRKRKLHPAFLVVLAGVIILAVFIKLNNPHKKYSQQKYWASATIDDVKEVPQVALLPGNKNGPVLMWAASAAKDPQIITVLVARGADVNEEDMIFSSTPLSGAAAYNSNPAIIDELVRLGAEVDKPVGSNNKTPLIIAAELNPEPKIIVRLIYHGADTSYRDITGRNALEAAIHFRNSKVIPILEVETR